MKRVPSITEPEDLRPSCLVELERLYDEPKLWVRCVGSPGAADRRYMQALGLLEQEDDFWRITYEGAVIVEKHRGKVEA